MVLDESDEVCTCKLLTSTDTEGNTILLLLLLLNVDDDIGASQIDGNKLTPYMKREALHVTSFDIYIRN